MPFTIAMHRCREIVCCRPTQELPAHRSAVALHSILLCYNANAMLPASPVQGSTHSSLRLLPLQVPNVREKLLEVFYGIYRKDSNQVIRCDTRHATCHCRLPADPRSAFVCRCTGILGCYLTHRDFAAL